MTGVLNLDKPAGISSAYALTLIKRKLKRGTKVGHAGTLDPFATGVLLVLIGKATRCSQALMSERKQYEATIRFGSTTPTDDPTEPETPFIPAGDGPLVPPNIEQVRQAITPLVGPIIQQPPSFSALRIGGRRAYEIARKGETVELKPRTVMVYAIELLEYQWPVARLRIDCGRGTYIRAIARDLGLALNVGGHLTALSRTAVGPFRIDAAASLEQLTTENIANHLHEYEPGTS